MSNRSRIERAAKKFKETLEIVYKKDIWDKKYVGTSLLANLNNLEQVELEQIAFVLGIYVDLDISKPELLDLLSEKLPIYVPLYLKNSDKQAFYLIQRLLNNNGMIRYYEKDRNLVLGLRYTGIFFPVIKDENKYIVMPEEILGSLKLHIDDSFEDLINQNQLVVDYLYGLLNLYGIIDYEHFIKSVRRDIEHLENEDQWYYLGLIKFQERVNPHFDSQNNKLYLFKIFHNDLSSLQDYYRSYNLRFKQLTKEEILKLGRQTSTETQTFTKLKTLFMEYFAIKDNDEGITEVLSALTEKMKVGYTFIECISFINQYFIFSRKDQTGAIAFLNKLLTIYFDTPMYALKGYTLAEAQKIANVYVPQINVSNYLDKLRYK